MTRIYRRVLYSMFVMIYKHIQLEESNVNAAMAKPSYKSEDFKFVAYLIFLVAIMV